MKCKGFLFDLDGTLVDSLPAVERAWLNWAQSRDLDPEEVLGFIHGKQAITSLRHFMPGESEESIQQQFKLLEKAEAEDTVGISALPGAAELLHRLNELSVPWAIVPPVLCRLLMHDTRPVNWLVRKCLSRLSWWRGANQIRTLICWEPRSWG